MAIVGRCLARLLGLAAAAGITNSLEIVVEAMVPSAVLVLGGISVKIESLLGMITIKLREDNFGYNFFDFFSGESQCPPKYIINTEIGVTKEITTAYEESIKTSLFSLLIATLSDEAIDYEIYASIFVVRVNQLKTEFHTAQKGADFVDKYLLQLKAIKDQLVAAGEKIIENDLVIATLSGLPPEFEMIKTVILARDAPSSMKDFRAQLIGAEGSIESRLTTLSSSMSAMYVQGNGSNTQGSQGNAQGYEQGESSNAHRSQGRNNYNGGNNNRRYNFNIRKFSGGYNGGNNNYRSYSTFGNDGKGVQNGGSQSSFSGNGSKQGNTWSGDTNYRNAISSECQICSRRGHTTPNCYLRADNNQSSGWFLCTTNNMIL
ncbi:FK506-binding protein 5-like [Pyrus ussuriensis x Pyrus communis]|uniref:FK506-binding protein 5-like n=1 Tax=Pyrus ussuriensis x Pyrus communis TaxID=2448454 RepID=A0A5N5GC85_9ROSA|nr:FK506-binding protein 5-like [Pyrus ussuriensis x Pyrus communis]